jgi:small-conductance mechanosensitive channel
MTGDVSNLMEAFDLSRLSLSITVLVIAFILGQLVKLIVVRFSKSFPEWKLRIEQIGTLISFLLVLGSIALAVFLLFRSREAAVAIGGSVGLAFAIGAKDIAASLLSGLIVIFDRSFQVGDRIKFGDIYGDVLSIGVRSTRVRTLDDSLVTVPNSQFMNSPVTSANAGALDMQVEIDLFVHLGSDLSRIRKIVTEAAVSSRYVFLEKPIQILFKDQFVGYTYCTRVRVKAYVIETAYEKIFESGFIERVHIAFEKHGVCNPLHADVLEK